MNVRYIFNSDGTYVAFLQEENLFSPDTKWLGFVRNGTDAYKRDGSYMGQLLNDDRIARKKTGTASFPVSPPLPPFTPYRPFAPFPRLRMSPLPWGWEDVFEHGPKEDLTHSDISTFQDLLGSELIGGDGTFLGVVTKNKFDTNSIGNQFGHYGSRYSASSIFNPYSQYGSKYSNYSPFNPYSSMPPAFKKNGYELGNLTVNKYIANRIDPEKFFLWFERL